MPDFDIDFDERRRGEVIRYVSDKYGDDRVSMIVTYGTIKAKQAVKDSSRILGYPFAMGDRITKAMPAAVMGKDVPLKEIFDPEHKRFGEGGEFRALYDGDNDVKTRRRHRHRHRGAQAPVGRARRRRDHVQRAAARRHPGDAAPGRRRDHHAVRLPDLREARPDQDGLPRAAQPDGPRRRADQHRVQPRREGRARGARADRRGDVRAAASAATPSASSSSTAARCGRCCAACSPDTFEDISAVGALYRPGPMGADSHNKYARRKTGREPVEPLHPELAEALEEVLGETYGLIVYQEQVMAIAQKLAGYTLGQADLLRRAMGKKKKEELDKQFATFSAGMTERGFSIRRDQGAVGHPAAVLRLRVQQGPLRGLRPGVLLDRLPQGQLPGRVHGRAPHVGQGRQGQDGDLPQRVPPDEDPGAAARRQRVARPTSPRSATTSGSG